MIFLLLLLIPAGVWLLRRRRRVVARRDALTVSREDRTGFFARTPGRFRGRPGL